MKRMKEINVTVLARPPHGLSMEQAISALNERRLELLSGKLLDETHIILPFKKQREIIPLWANPFTVIVDADNTFRQANPGDNGAYVICKDVEANVTYRFPVPRDLRNYSNYALAVNQGLIHDSKLTIEVHENGEEKDGTTSKLIHISDERNIRAVPIPKTSGYYLTELNYGLPTGMPIDYNPKLGKPPGMHYFVRGDTRVGFVRRDFVYYASDMKPFVLPEIYLCNPPSLQFGVFAIDAKPTCCTLTYITRGEFQAYLLEGEMAGHTFMSTEGLESPAGQAALYILIGAQGRSHEAIEDSRRMFLKAREKALLVEDRSERNELLGSIAAVQEYSGFTKDAGETRALTN